MWLVKICVCVLTALLIFSFMINQAGAQWLVNGGTPVVTEPERQHHPLAVPDGSGGAIFIWLDDTIELEGALYAQRLDAGGYRLWAPGGVPVTSLSGAKKHPSWSQIMLVEQSSHGTSLTPYPTGIFSLRE